MDLEVRHLRLVVSVAEEGSLTRAARRLHLTQSALSHQLRDIEGRVGGLLYYRMNRKLVLTQAGEKLLASASQVLERLQQTEEEMRAIADGREGLLRISTQCYTCYHWLPAALSSFHGKFPGVDVRIVLEATYHPIEALLEGRLDLAIAQAPVADKRLILYPLFEDEMFAVMNPQHRLASRSYLRPEDFAEETLLMYPIPTESSYLFCKVLLPAGVVPRQISKMQLTEAMIEMAAAGLGICVLAGWAVAPYLDTHHLRAVPVTRRGLHREWLAAAIHTDRVPDHIEEFVRLIRESAPNRKRRGSTKMRRKI